MLTVGRRVARPVTITALNVLNYFAATGLMLSGTPSLLCSGEVALWLLVGVAWVSMMMAQQLTRVRIHPGKGRIALWSVISTFDCFSGWFVCSRIAEPTSLVDAGRSFERSSMSFADCAASCSTQRALLWGSGFLPESSGLRLSSELHDSSELYGEFVWGLLGYVHLAEPVLEIARAAPLLFLLSQ